MNPPFLAKKRVPDLENGHPIAKSALLALATGLLASCGGSGDAPENREMRSDADLTVDESRDNTEAVNAYYAANPDFFTFATPEDIPSDLTWENGMDLPEIGSDEATKGGTWHQGLPDFPRTFRHFGPDANGGFRMYLIDLTMPYAQRHPNTEDGFFPGLAKEWALDQENARVFIRLNENATWSDGVPVTTGDAMFRFYIMQTEYNQAPWYQNWYGTQYKNFTKYDDRTFAITMAEAKPDFYLYPLGDSPEPQHFYKGYQEDFVEYYQWKIRPVLGPYIIDAGSVRKGKGLALKRLDDWWAKDQKFWKNRYNPDRIELEVVRDTEKMVEKFLAGDFETTTLNLAKNWYGKVSNDLDKVQNGYIRKATFYNKVPTGGLGLWLNTTKPPLDNLDVRKGIAHATDFETVIEKFFRGDWARENTTNTGYGEATNPNTRARDFDPVKAAEFFAKAGFTTRGPDGIFVNEAGQRLSFTITTGAKTLTDALTILQQQARKAGLEFKLEIVDSTVAWKKAQEKNHEITFTGFGYGTTELYPRFWETFHGENAFEEDGSVKPQTNNYSMLNDPEINQMILDYRAATDHETKVTLAHQLEEKVFDSAVYVYGVYNPMFRVGYWRGVEWPEDFNVMRTDRYDEYMVHWINEAQLAETMEAEKSGGKTFEPAIEEFDRYK